MTTPTTRITVSDLLDNPVSDAIQMAGSKALQDQSWWDRRKNTLAGVANLILQVVNVLAFMATDVHWGVTVAIAVLVGMAEVVVHAATKGPVTPSGVEKMRREAQSIEVVDDGEDKPFSVYHEPIREG